MFRFLVSITQWITSPEEAWFLVLDEGTVIEDRQKRRSAIVQNIRSRDAGARRYEREISGRVGKLSLHEVWAIVNPLSMAKFFKYSFADLL